MKNIAVYTSLFVFFLSSMLVKAQGDKQVCRDYITAYLKEMAQFEIPKGKEVYQMDMEVKMKYAKGKVSPDKEIMEEKISIYNGSKEYFFKSGSIIVYVSERLSYVVLLNDRQIVFNDGTDKLYQENNFIRNVKLQDSILRHSKIVYCGEKDKNSKEINIRTSKKIGDKTGIRQINFKFHAKTKRLRRITNIFDKRSILLKQTFELKNLDFKCKENLTELAFNQLFNKDKSLKARFKGFKITDRRTEKK